MVEEYDSTSGELLGEGKNYSLFWKINCHGRHFFASGIRMCFVVLVQVNFKIT